MDNLLNTRVLDHVEANLDRIVATSVQRYFEQVPAYAESLDPDLRADSVLHTRAVFEAVLITLREDRLARPDDFKLTPAHTVRRIGSGLDLSDFLRGFRIGQMTLWEGIIEAAATEPDTRGVALEAATHVMEVIEVGSSVAAAAYVQVQQVEIAERDRMRRDLLEDLLVGRVVQHGPKAGLARARGLGLDTPVLVVVAEPVRELAAGQTLRGVLTTVLTTLGESPVGIAVIRQDQIVGVHPTPAGDEQRVVADLQRAQRSVAAHGAGLAVGVSTVHPGLAGIPEAYREALIAREAQGTAPGVMALSMISTVDYLVMREDRTARRLVRPGFRTFIEEDLEQGGVLVDTLRAYVACDLNAKTAAERLHVHANTVYYRLDKIAERTGCDLRVFGDIEELLMAVRLLARRPSPTS